MLAQTADATREPDVDGRPPRPGVVIVFSGTSAMSLPLPADGKPLVLGRAGDTGFSLPDERLSRNHCAIVASAQGWTVRDLGSRNGTFVDGVAVTGQVSFASPTVIRAADTLLVPCRDLPSYRPVETEGPMIFGWKMQDALAAIDRAAAASETLLVAGESGTGKEVAAKRFHERGPNADGPLVPVNCATIPAGLAERLLFGAKKGAYSGASADVTGHIAAADGGVLFLDEGAELDLAVQAKLLRVLEMHEVVPLGGTRAAPVSLRVCVATHVPLRRAVAEGKFRADLYHRIAPPEVVLPPLRERLDEMAYHIVAEVTLAATGLSPQPRLVEACMLRPWPGNVRELRRHIRDAAMRAAGERADRVRVEHLAPSAGQPLGPPPSRRPTPTSDRPARAYVRHSEELTKDAIERALSEHEGNVSKAARSLGLQRTQLYREMERHALGRAGKRH